MFIKTYSYRFSKEILSNSVFNGLYQQILDICMGCPLPYDERKSKKETNCIVQQIMNTYFRLQFQDSGWIGEANATDENSQDKMRADFRKEFTFEDNKIVCQIEVEFGNAASVYRDYFKFMDSYSQGLTDIGILIVPSADIAKHITSGVANYEKTLRELPDSKLSITIPVLVIGLFDEDEAGNKVEIWNLAETGYTLNAVKGSSLGPGRKGRGKSSNNIHIQLVQNYIDKLKNNATLMRDV